ncbi:MAG TPA: TonB-dependent receptor, partial [Chitinophagaceae bacterium]|nr:TonB-dependent receptor [Chitinophagaceae bacterium]
MRKLLLLSGCCLFLLATIFAQQREVTGKILDKDGLPLAGASIRNISNNRGVTTSADGSFRILAENNHQLEITMVGYQKQTITVSGSEISVSLTPSTTELSQVVMVGTRTAGRVRTETPVPVDLVNIAQASLPTARMDITSILNIAAPSFNYNKQSGSDGADHVDLATLRGLGPDQTLVLVNGKRRHQTAFVAVFGTRGRGNSGTDLNAIPAGAIDRVEILRDGASAQYGSDAIAGVVNLILKKTTNRITGNIGWAGYHDPKFNTAYGSDELKTQYENGRKIDGNSLSASLNFGLPLGKKNGFINMTLEGLTTGKTYRQALKTEDYYNDDDAMYVNIYRRAHGDASLDMAGGFVNAELPINEQLSFYGFGGINRKESDAFAFTRNFSARPDRFPTDANGDLIFVPDIMRVSSDGETYYSPHIQTKILDYSVTGGFKGRTKSNWTWDLSNTYGKNDFHFYGDKTFNASAGPYRNHFDDGGFSFLQNTANLNISKELGSGLNLAFGAEYRYENYRIYAGEEASYTNYDPSGVKATGSQGFPGYQPADVVDANRSVIGAYVDAEYDVNEKWLVNGAFRYEHYSDFGSTGNVKLASRVKATPDLNIRGSFSTGFRAPSLQQINFSSTFTTVQATTIAEVKIAP